MSDCVTRLRVRLCDDGGSGIVPADLLSRVVVNEGGATYLDRTTLTPRPGGEVRQHIEVSTDQGASWRSTFDAVYRPRGRG